MSRHLRILYLTKDSPFNLRGHAAQRAHGMIVEWSKQVEVSVLFFYPGPATKEQRLAGANGFEISSSRTFFEKFRGLLFPYHFRLIGRRFAEEVLKKAKGEKFDAIVAEELTMADQARYLSTKLQIPFFYIAHNFESYLFEQITDGALDRLRSFILRSKEKAIMKSAKSAFAFSKNDADRFANTFKLHSVKTTSAGIDLNSVKYTEHRDNNRELLIIGALDYFPNVESVEWFAKEIFPRLKNAYQVIVAGRNPTEHVKEICRASGFELIASPLDMNPILARGSIEVVPLLKGSGTRGKILEAMAAGLPIISTELGCEGLGLEDKKHLLVAKNEIEFAELIESTMQNQIRRHELAKSAHEKVQEFSYARVAQRLAEEILNDL